MKKNKLAKASELKAPVKLKTPISADPPVDTASPDAQPTRLFVKNLPPNATEADLRRLFVSHGPLTDVQLKYSPDGKFRRFAFVGFRTPHAASSALDGLNGAYIGSSCIQLMRCRAMHAGDGNGVGSSTSGKGKNAKSKSSEIVDEELVDEAPTSAGPSGNIPTGPCVVKLKGCPPGIQARHVREFFAPLSVKLVKIAKTGCAYARLATEEEAEKAVAYNKRSMGKKKVLVRRMTSQAATIAAAGNPSQERIKQRGGGLAASGLDQEAQIQDTGRLFVRNLPYDVTEAELMKLFEPFGQVSELHLSYQSLLKRNKGFAFVAYLFPEHALKAYKALDRSDYMGRNLHILPGDNKPDDDEEVAGCSDGRKLTSYQKKKAQELRAASGSHSSSWNALFLGSDTVASLVSEQLGEAKSNLLAESQYRPGDGASVAVRLAHGEADVVAQTRRFLEENGVDLSSFGSGSAQASTAVRSDRIFLVKNLPSGATLEQLSEIYAKFPGFQRLILPPRRGVTAIVEFANPQEARTAYKKTAFSRFVDRPIYLEWAPVGCLKDKVEQPVSEKTTEKTAHTDPRSKVLIRNVAFEANSKELRTLLEPFGEIITGGVRLPKKPEGGHRGFAFVQFASAESARRAVEQLSGSTHLYGRRLLLELSGGGDETEADGLGPGVEDPETQRLRKRAALSSQAERAVKKRSRVVLDNDRDAVPE